MLRIITILTLLLLSSTSCFAVDATSLATNLVDFGVDALAKPDSYPSVTPAVTANVRHTYLPTRSTITGKIPRISTLASHTITRNVVSLGSGFAVATVASLAASFAHSYVVGHPDDFPMLSRLLNPSYIESSSAPANGAVYQCHNLSNGTTFWFQCGYQLGTAWPNMPLTANGATREPGKFYVDYSGGSVRWYGTDVHNNGSGQPSVTVREYYSTPASAPTNAYNLSDEQWEQAIKNWDDSIKSEYLPEIDKVIRSNPNVVSWPEAEVDANITQQQSDAQKSAQNQAIVQKQTAYDAALAAYKASPTDVNRLALDRAAADLHALGIYPDLASIDANKTAAQTQVDAAKSRLDAALAAYQANSSAENKLALDNATRLYQEAIASFTAATETLNALAHNDSTIAKTDLESAKTAYANDPSAANLAALNNAQLAYDAAAAKAAQAAEEKAAADNALSKVPETSVYDSTITPPDPKSIASLLGSWVASSPLASMVRSFVINTSDEVKVVDCGNFYGKELKFDFTRYESTFITCGGVLLVIAHGFAVLIVMRGW
jgi:hypothetical protein